MESVLEQLGKKVSCYFHQFNLPRNEKIAEYLKRRLWKGFPMGQNDRDSSLSYQTVIP